MDDITIHDDDTHYSGLERLEGPDDTPHGCYDGLVFIGYLAQDEESGEEVERLESIPCRRCADKA